MSEELTYLDLLVLRKIDADSSVEKFGQQINTSFFEAANILGTMKIKGLVDIQSSIGGQSPLMVTGTGSDALAAAAQKASEPLDALDSAILKAMGSGARELTALQNQLNIRSSDLAFHLHKLKSQDCIDHEVRSGKVLLSLTEKGFIGAGGATWLPAAPQGAPAPAVNVPASSVSEGQAASSAPSSQSSLTSAPKDIQDLLGFGHSKAATKPAGSRAGASGGEGAQRSSSGPSAQAPSGAASGKPPLDSDSGEPRRLDRHAMRISKLEYYAKAYAPYALLLVLLVLFVGFALLIGMNKPPVA